MHFWWWKIGHNLPIKKRQNSGFQWELKHLPTAQIWDTPKKEATYTEDRYHRKGYIIVNNNLCFLMLFFFVLCMSRWIWKLCNIGPGCWTLEACQEFGWHCGVIWQELCKLAFIFGCRLASGRIPFFHGIHLYIHRYNPHTTPMATTGTWTCPLILQELQENKWCNLLPGAWAGSDCLQWMLLKVNFAGRGKTPHAAKILPD